MAKSRLEIELSNRKPNWKYVEEIVKKYRAYNKYWNMCTNMKFRKMLIKNLPNFLYEFDEKVFSQLKENKYKGAIQEYYTELCKFLSDGYYYTNIHSADKHIELINKHEIDVSLGFLNGLYGKSNEYGTTIYMKPETMFKYKEYVLSETHRVYVSNLHLVKDDLTKEQVLELINSNNIKIPNFYGVSNGEGLYPEFAELIKGKLTLSEILNSVDRVDYDVIKLYGIDNYITELMKLEKPMNVWGLNSCDPKNTYVKVDLTEEQTSTLLKHQTLSSLSNMFNLASIEETFVYDLCNCEDPSIYSEKVNTLILEKDFDSFKKNNYNFISFRKINLTKETAKILHDDNRLTFKYYKKFISDEEILSVVKDKEAEVAKMFVEFNDNDREPLDDEMENSEDYYRGKVESHRNRCFDGDKILNIIRDYDLSLDFVLKTFIDKKDDGETKLMIASMFLDGMGRGRGGFGSYFF